MYGIDYHADDYGISINNSKRIIELIEAEKLDSISIIANMGCFDECMRLLCERWDTFNKKPLIAVHINLIDGYRMSAKKNGEIIKGSWGKLFVKSYIPGPQRIILKHQLAEEIKAQIGAVYAYTKHLLDNQGNQVGLRLDSHVHTHMIPIVFDSMIQAADDLHILGKISYIRNSKEPLMMFWTTRGIVGTFPMVNVIKNIILNILGQRVRKKLDELDIPTGMLWGLILSGKMDHERITILLPKMQKYAQNCNEYLEILCHPGIVLEGEKRPEYGPEDMETFFSSNRDIEYDMVMRH